MDLGQGAVARPVLERRALCGEPAPERLAAGIGAERVEDPLQQGQLEGHHLVPVESRRAGQRPAGGVRGGEVLRHQRGPGDVGEAEVEHVPEAPAGGVVRARLLGERRQVGVQRVDEDGAAAERPGPPDELLQVAQIARPPRPVGVERVELGRPTPDRAAGRGRIEGRRPAGWPGRRRWAGAGGTRRGGRAGAGPARGAAYRPRGAPRTGTAGGGPRRGGSTSRAPTAAHRPRPPWRRGAPGGPRRPCCANRRRRPSSRR